MTATRAKGAAAGNNFKMEDLRTSENAYIDSKVTANRAPFVPKRHLAGTYSWCIGFGCTPEEAGTNTTNTLKPEYASDPNGTTIQPTVSKDAAKLVNNPSKAVGTEVKSVLPTQATGADPKTPIIAPENIVADYYRYGKFTVGEVNQYDTLPRAFDPIDNKVAASIRIFGKRSEDDVAKDLLPAYTKFFLESVQESHVERSQVIETFGDFYVFFFGERPPVYNFSGTLMNSVNANWVTDFMFMYEQYLRGTRCVQMNASTIVTYGGRQIEGLITNITTQTTAGSDGGTAFSFSVIVFERKFFNFSADMGYATNDNMNRVVDTKFTELLKSIAGPEGAGSSDPLVSKAIGEAKSVMDGGVATGISK